MLYSAYAGSSAVASHGTTVIKITVITISVILAASVIILVIVGVALGVGLGLGLKKDDPPSSSDGAISTRSSTVSTTSDSYYGNEGADTGNFSVLSAPIVNCVYTGSSSCGCSPVQPSFLSPRIVQGYSAVANSWPWMVAIFMVNGNTQSFCGGFLITYQHVITAAHCVYQMSPNMITVYGGIQKLSERSKGQSRRVSTINSHPGYLTTSGDDIAVLTLQSPFSETSTIGKCCLPLNTTLPSASEHAVIIGWGQTSFNSAIQPNNLLQGVVQIQNNTVCRTAGINQFCAIYGGTDSCFGDSGGPLMTSVNNAWTCTGVVNSGLVVNGKSCGTLGFYARVAAYQSFINNIISG